MKKNIALLLLFTSTLLSSCTINNQNSSTSNASDNSIVDSNGSSNSSNSIVDNKLTATAKESLKDVNSALNLTINETLIVDDNGENETPIVNQKKGYYQNGTIFQAYAEIQNLKAYFTKPNCNYVEMYVNGQNYAVFQGTKRNDLINDIDNTMVFTGLEGIFNDAISREIDYGTIGIINNKMLVQHLYYDLGYLIDYNTFLSEGDEVSYQFYFDDDGSLISLDVDCSGILKKCFPSITKATKTYTFQMNIGEGKLKDFPFIEDDKPDKEKLDQELREYSLAYIDGIYSKMHYIGNSVKFISRAPKTGRLTYVYSSSRPDILSSEGIFVAPQQDTNITLNISLRLDDEEFASKSYDLIAYKKEVRSGELGSKQNPLYNGKAPLDEVNIYFIEMHEQYGDAIYIQAGEFDMLIDAGQNSDGYYVSQFVKEHALDSTLEMVVATHAHGDHIGGMASVLSNINQIGYALDYGYDRASYYTSSVVRDMMKEKATSYYAVTDALKNNNGVIWIADDFYITILNTYQYIEPGKDIGDGDDNEASVTFIMTFKNHSYYFSGDLDSGGENNMVSSGQLKNVDLMKASHHASRTGNSSNLLRTIRPEVVVVSTALVSRGNEQSNANNQPHPNAGALGRFYDVNAKVYCNFTMGTVHVTSKGSGSLEVEGLGVSSPYYMGGKAITGEQNLEFKDTAWAKEYR